MPESIHLKAPAGMTDSIREAARSEGTSAAEFIRRAIRDWVRVEKAQELQVMTLWVAVPIGPHDDTPGIP